MEKSNQQQITNTINLIEKNCGNLKGKNISILGLSFKPKTDDIRDSISIIIIEKLLKKHAKIKVHDPMAIKNTKEIFADKISYSQSINESLNSTECAIIMTPWKHYRKLSRKDFQKMKNRVIIDTRRLLNNKDLGVEFHAIGIGKEKIS